MVVLRLRFKLNNESRLLKSLGRLFQRSGALKENALVPSNVSILTCGTSNNIVLLVYFSVKYPYIF